MKFKNIKKNTFNKENLIASKEHEEREFAILRSYLPDIFMTENQPGLKSDEIGAIRDFYYDLIANIRREDDRPKHIHTEDYLPYNTQNEKWMVKYIMRTIKDITKENERAQKSFLKIHKEFEKNHKVITNDRYDEFSPAQKNDYEEKYDEIVLVDSNKHTKISAKTILKFIQTDPAYQQARTNYTVGLTLAQVEYMMNAQEPNEVLTRRRYSRTEPYSVETIYHPSISRFKKDTDKLFRNGAFVGLTQNLHLDPEAVEYGLEKYADIWLDQTMSDAYYNQYMVDVNDMDAMHYKEWYFDTVLHQFRNDWMTKRKHEYEQEHRAVMQKAGRRLMNLAPEAVKALNSRVDMLNERFQEMVIKFNAKKTHTFDNDRNADITL